MLRATVLPDVLEHISLANLQDLQKSITSRRFEWPSSLTEAGSRFRSKVSLFGGGCVYVVDCKRRFPDCKLKPIMWHLHLGRQCSKFYKAASRSDSDKHAVQIQMWTLLLQSCQTSLYIYIYIYID